MLKCDCYLRLNVAVTPRKRRVSRNTISLSCFCVYFVTPRKRRVSRNAKQSSPISNKNCHASQEACE